MIIFENNTIFCLCRVYAFTLHILKNPYDNINI
jgi:hypothetical protein